MECLRQGADSTPSLTEPPLMADLWDYGAAQEDYLGVYDDQLK